MSLLRHGRETVTLFPEESCTDDDGNPSSRASSVGVIARASVQPMSRPTDTPEGTKSGGFDTTSRYRMRITSGWPDTDLLGAQAQVEWRGIRYSLDGDGELYASSPNTTHTVYTLVRA